VSDQHRRWPGVQNLARAFGVSVERDLGDRRAIDAGTRQVERLDGVSRRA
jgi:hypothetical protein